MYAHERCSGAEAPGWGILAHLHRGHVPPCHRLAHPAPRLAHGRRRYAHRLPPHLSPAFPPPATTPHTGRKLVEARTNPQLRTAKPGAVPAVRSRAETPTQGCGGKEVEGCAGAGRAWTRLLCMMIWWSREAEMAAAAAVGSSKSINAKHFWSLLRTLTALAPPPLRAPNLLNSFISSSSDVCARVGNEGSEAQLGAAGGGSGRGLRGLKDPTGSKTI